MFSSKGLFREFQCPQKEECLLPVCWFSHDVSSPPKASEAGAAEYDPLNTPGALSPPLKRRKLGDATSVPAAASVADTSVTPPLMQKSSTRPDNIARASSFAPIDAARHKSLSMDRDVDAAEHSQKSKRGVLAPPKPAKVPPGKGGHKVSKESDMAASSTADTSSATKTPTSMQRPISPPPKSASTTPASKPSTVSPVMEESLRPRLLATGPDWKVRDALLKVLQKNLIARNNEIIRQVKEGKKALAPVRLLPWEIITLALDEEIDLAKKFGTGVYQNVLKQRIHAISKMDHEQWKALVTDKVARISRLAQRKGAIGAAQEVILADKQIGEREIIPGLSQDGELMLLERLRQPLEKLQGHGYVTEAPTAKQIEEELEMLKDCDGWEKCDRCASRFQVFPGRNLEGLLASGGRCQYHWARAGRGSNTKEARFECCRQPVGSPGCTEAEYHVFNDKSLARLASVWQWEKTPHSEQRSDPVSFDCEMVYTTNGMEVVRVTVVSWPTNRTLLDILVRPYGEILDLNTRFSGVTKKVYAETPPYDGTAAVALEAEHAKVGKVASPAQARQLLFDIIAPNTPLLGHAIDNDLNTLRVIHPFVIDTVLLYPHPRGGLPMRQSLRNLAFEHLDGRRIQNAAEQGHDSREDAVATGDLVTKAVKAYWAKMQANGWRLQDGLPVRGGADDSKL
ncbi:RNA exonuclease 3 [Cyphellophora attinorum]|uniref:RNA exonuclease 3 n=1 Tax=Cyphellophora attinorum TaxID=1664694 RepID=A0A0N0NQ17_9EURO|nr:RNA exonuclease 3 [Phialophora attinorum]KPI43388.1 RNA exonuclease 3 [Phialophora attinorum]